MGAFRLVVKAEALGVPMKYGSINVAFTFEVPLTGAMFVDCFPVAMARIVETQRGFEEGNVALFDTYDISVLGGMASGFQQGLQQGLQNRQQAQEFRQAQVQAALTYPGNSLVSWDAGDPQSTSVVTVSETSPYTFPGAATIYSRTMAPADGSWSYGPTVSSLMVEISMLKAQLRLRAAEEAQCEPVKEERRLRQIDV